jgi:hypothetical protein
MSTAASSKSNNAADLIPVPIFNLGYNYVLQHNRSQDISTFINNSYATTNRIFGGSFSDVGVNWANSNIKIGVSFIKGSYKKFLENSPMIIMEVLNHNGNNSANQKGMSPMWLHPVNNAGPLNRTNTNYGGGDPSTITTEWNLQQTKPFAENVIEINQKALYRNNGPILPQRWVDFISDNGNNLRYQRTRVTPTNGNGVVSTFKQPVRFRFAYIDNGRIVLGEPSETLIISPKWGEFSDNDTYVYDWTISHRR